MSNSNQRVCRVIMAAERPSLTHIARVGGEFKNALRSGALDRSPVCCSDTLASTQHHFWLFCRASQARHSARAWRCCSGSIAR
jgi:hypothetical protein